MTIVLQSLIYNPTVLKGMTSKGKPPKTDPPPAFLLLLFLLKSAKIFNYAGWRRTCNFFFTMFAAVFIVTRLVILPFW